LCIQDVGYQPRKSETIDRSFDTFNYSIILSGAGVYCSGKVSFAVSAPCVITQLPGRHATYGPPSGSTWGELYLILPPGKLPEVEQRGLMGANPPLKR